MIDVLAKFRALSNGKGIYQQDYALVSRLQELAVRRSITILVVHHTRKGTSDDPVEEISGTLGLGGGVDAFLVLKRTGSGATLTGRGRDIEDIDLAVQFNRETCQLDDFGRSRGWRRRRLPRWRFEPHGAVSAATRSHASRVGIGCRLKRPEGLLMRRREFIVGFGGAVAWPMAARAQQPAMPVIGWLATVPGTIERLLPMFSRGLAQAGYVVGRNVKFVSREGGRDQQPALAADLVRRHVTVIVATGGASCATARSRRRRRPSRSFSG